MLVELKIPEVGESITEVEIGDWLKQKGDAVAKDESVVTLESDKATVELPSPVSGRIAQVLREKGQTAKIGEVIAQLESDGRGADQTKSAGKGPATAAASAESAPKRAPEPAALAPAPRVMPAAEHLMAERGLAPRDVPGTGPGGRILKEDVLRAQKNEEEKDRKKEPPPSGKETSAPPSPPSGLAASRPSQMRSQALSASTPSHTDRPEEEVIPMSRLRATVAQRMVEAKQNAALLTTFNEIDMSAVMEQRHRYGEAFLKKYEVKLGFMSFFVKACVDALKQFPAINAEVRGTNIVYRNYFDIGVAIGGGKGLVVPVLRHAERLSFAEIERTIAEFGGRAKENKLSPEDLRGGTFTISNGGIYGSLLSTPIVNPPQSGILGMHAIQDRPVARDGSVVIRPMMYIALTYDHRIVDGREAVTFLKRIKEAIEAPARMLLEI
jgi:2-oxoglutarate dehydrogenase E2 component (dihydrolipoamide succinyltransferase)